MSDECQHLQLVRNHQPLAHVVMQQPHHYHLPCDELLQHLIQLLPLQHLIQRLHLQYVAQLVPLQRLVQLLPNPAQKQQCIGNGAEEPMQVTAATLTVTVCNSKNDSSRLLK